MIMYQKTESGAEMVFMDGKKIGFVQKREDWTVRGTRVRWEAMKNGRYLTTDALTRREAVDFLKPSQS